MAEIGTLGDIVFKVSANKVRTFDDLKIDSKTNLYFVNSFATSFLFFSMPISVTLHQTILRMF